MRPSLMLSCLALLAACQTADRGTPPDASTPAAAPAPIPVTIQAQPAPATVPVAAAEPAAAAPAAAPANDAACSTDVALECLETEVDGCLTGQTTVHRCVSTADQ